eukprot:Amastigsp_a1_36393.p2 type:complete len:377 gc:universal Amastigsp_a1_36393:1207-77(-)
MAATSAASFKPDVASSARDGSIHSGRVALITGITGQDGSYLTEFLLEKGYTVHGIVRRSSSFNTGRIEHLYQDPHTGDRRVVLHYGDLTDSSNILRIVLLVNPDEVYNLAAQSHVQVSFQMPEYTADVDAVGTLRILDAVRHIAVNKPVKFYQASTSELYGKVVETPQTETTPFYPRSPYAVAKQYGYWIVVNYREAYNLHASNGILFNHESPRRGPTFVTRKITMAVARIDAGVQKTLYLGNLDAKRDWGHARDYVKGMWMILQAAEPSDFVLATGETHTVREFCELAFAVVGVTLRWEGEGVDEVAISSKTNEVVIRIDPAYFRPTEVDLLLGDPAKAKRVLGWESETPFPDLVREMVEHDVKLLASKGPEVRD